MAYQSYKVLDSSLNSDIPMLRYN